MKTIEQIKVELKTANPTLQRGSDEDGYEQISADEYDLIIESWAQAAYAKELKAQAKEEAQAQREALLNRLGITADEAKLLLG